MQTLLAKGIAIAIATYEASRNITSGNSIKGGGIPVVNQNNSRLCSYNDFLACKLHVFYDMEGVVRISR